MGSRLGPATPTDVWIRRDALQLSTVYAAVGCCIGISDLETLADAGLVIVADRAACGRAGKDGSVFRLATAAVACFACIESDARALEEEGLSVFGLGDGGCGKEKEKYIEKCF